ncbi:MAG: glycosyltransferase family 4 protein [Promethearchaeota archaeon]
MNIIFITSIYLYKKFTNIKMIGGIETNTKNVIQELRKRDHQVWEEEIDPNIPIWIQQGDVDIIAASTFDPLTFLKIIKYKKKAKKTTAIVIHAHTTVEDMAGNFLPNMKFFNNLFKFWLKVYYGAATLLITPSEYSKQCILNIFNSLPCPIHVVSNGIRIENFLKKSEYRKKFRAYLMEKYNVPLDSKIILNVGLTWKKKGVDTFMVLAKHFPNYYFVWVGPLSKNPDIEKASKLKNLIFTGYYRDIREAYYGADLFLNTSRVENQGIPLIEAAICELPIIASDLPAYDWIENGLSGIKAKTIKEFVDGIQKLMNDESLARNLSLHARQKAIELHDFSKIGEKIEQLYLRALKIKELRNKKKFL